MNKNYISLIVCIVRYRCDSFPDCPGGDDESDSLCGYDPCKGKIRCPELDSRCIDPSEYCCDPHTHPDTCPFLYPCCESVIEFSIRSRLSQQWDSDLSRDNDAETLTTLHSTIYIIIGQYHHHVSPYIYLYNLRMFDCVPLDNVVSGSGSLQTSHCSQAPDSGQRSGETSSSDHAS